MSFAGGIKRPAVSYCFAVLSSAALLPKGYYNHYFPLFSILRPVPLLKHFHHTLMERTILFFLAQKNA